MGYDLHVTRAGFWAENEGQSIGAEEWLKVVSEDPSLTLDAANGPCFAVLSDSDGDAKRWLDWRDGNVYSTNPDRRTLEKMLAVAKALGGRVQGDDGEHYEHVEDLPYDPPGGAPASRDPDELPAYMQQERRSNRIMYGLIALAIVSMFVVRQFL